MLALCMPWHKTSCLPPLQTGHKTINKNQILARFQIQTYVCFVPEKLSPNLGFKLSLPPFSLSLSQSLCVVLKKRKKQTKHIFLSVCAKSFSPAPLGTVRINGFYFLTILQSLPGSKLGI